MPKQKKEKFNKIGRVKFKGGEIYGGWVENPKVRKDVIRIGYIIKGEEEYWQMTPKESVSLLMVAVEALWAWLFSYKEN